MSVKGDIVAQEGVTKEGDSIATHRQQHCTVSQQHTGCSASSETDRVADHLSCSPVLL